MKSTAPKRFGSITVLSLLALLAIAVAAQAVLAASSSSTPGAGTEGRGGIATPSSAPTSTAPAPGTEGRGGAPLLSDSATLVLEDTTASSGYLLLSKDGVPQPVTYTASTSFSAWVSVGIAAAVALVVLAAWAASRRRRPTGEDSTAAFCAQHPADAMCVIA